MSMQSSDKNNIIISNCKCKSEYQDKKYGKGNRVFNRGKQREKLKNEGRCTVCATVKTF